MSFLQQKSTEVSIKFLRQIALECASLGSRQTKAVFKLLSEGRYMDVINFHVDYEDDNIDDIFYTRQIMALVSKQDFIPLGVDLDKVALEKFHEAEEKCRQTNIRLDNPKSADADVSAVFHYAIRKISRLLGDVPTLTSLDFSFGPGATTSIKRSRSHPRVKLEDQLACSINLVPLLGRLFDEVPCWVNDHLDPNTGNVKVSVEPAVLQFVPKTSLTKRSICIEPTLNTFFQQGIGRYLKRRLKRAGIDLSDQDRNKSLAKEGSIDGSLATIDLSSASDTISKSLVWQLLPYDWAVLLDALRSPIVSLPDGSQLLLEKFSSMGNSYTFELESLIFWGLAEGCLDHLSVSDEKRNKLSVYGDDIIVPTEAVELLKKVLEYSGFSLNWEKSFTSGSFRESCGADYVRGIDVRPFYLKEKVSVRYLYVFHNWLMRRFEFSLAKLVKSFIPPCFLIYGPDGYGDGHLIGDWKPEPLNRVEKRRGYEGFKFQTYVASPRRLKRLAKDYHSSTYALYMIERKVYTSDIMEVSTQVDHTTVPGFDSFALTTIYTFDNSVFCYHRARQK